MEAVARLRHYRGSAQKVRLVADLIRMKPVGRALATLGATPKGCSSDLKKLVESAVANAQHNDEQDPDELYVKACFADEGPTLRRFRPRARGRATRIRKRTCHITIIVARMDDRMLEIVTARRERQGGTGGRRIPSASTAARRARVEASRQRAAARKAAAEGGAPDESGDEVVETEAVETDVVETESVDAEVVEAEVVETEVVEAEAADEAPAADESENAEADDTAEEK